MDKATVVRWTSIGLHGIVLVFALFVAHSLTEGDVMSVLSSSKTDVALRQALSLSALLIFGNMLAVVLFLTPLYLTFGGVCILIAYELIFLATSFLFLSIEYSFVIGIVAIALLSIARTRRNVNQS